MASISTMATTHINIMLKNIYQTVMIMKMNNKLLLPIFLLSVSSCAISGMNMEIHKKNEKEFVFLDNKKEQRLK